MLVLLVLVTKVKTEHFKPETQRKAEEYNGLTVKIKREEKAKIPLSIFTEVLKMLRLLLTQQSPFSGAIKKLRVRNGQELCSVGSSP